MRQQLVRLGAAAVMATVTLSACSSSAHQAATGSPSTSATQAHNSTDLTFAQDMTPCHKQAIQMSEIILTKQGLDPRVVQVANQIKARSEEHTSELQSRP